MKTKFLAANLFLALASAAMPVFGQSTAPGLVMSEVMTGSPAPMPETKGLVMSEGSAPAPGYQPTGLVMSEAVAPQPNTQPLGLVMSELIANWLRFLLGRN